MKKSKNRKKTMIERLREIRDKISLDIQDMNFEEMEEYFSRHSKINDSSVWKKKYKASAGHSIAAEPKAKYGKNED